MAAAAIVVAHRRGHLARLWAFVAPMIAATAKLRGRHGAEMLGTTIVIWALEASVWWATGEASGLDLGAVEACYLLALASMFAMIPSGPGYAGTMDAAVIFGARVLDRTASAALSYLLLLRFVLFVPITLVGLVLLVVRYGPKTSSSVGEVSQGDTCARPDMSELAEAIWEQVPLGAVPEHFAPRRDWLLGRVARGARVLDVGCGAGEFATALREAGAVPVGVDVAREALRRAAERDPALDLRLWAHGEPLPAEDASFDVAWAGEVLEHVVDLAPWLSEVRRVLRPGGELLVSTPHHGPGRLLALALSRRRFAAHFEPRGDHVRFFSPATLRELLDDLGFDVLEARPALRRTTILCRAVRP